MRKLMFFVLSLVPALSFAYGKLQAFDEIKFVASKGKPLHIVTDFSKCSTNNNGLHLTAFSQFNPVDLKITNDGIITSHLHFTINNPKFYDQPVYEFIKYYINKDNVTITYNILDAKNYQKMINEITIRCALNNGANIYY